MKRIICPIDFSNASLNAARYAAQFALKVNTPLTLVYLINKSNSVIANPAGVEMEEDGIYDDPEFRLRQYCAELSETYSINCADYIISKKDLFSAVNEMIDDIDLFIIGMDYNRKIINNLEEEETYELLNNIGKPFLIIPEFCQFRNIDRIVFGTKYGALDIPAIKSMIDLFDPYNPDIYIVHMSNRIDYQKSQEFKDYCHTIESAIPTENCLHFHHIHGTEITNALVNFSQDVQNQIIAIITDYKNILQKARVEKLIKITDRVLLLIPNK